VNQVTDVLEPDPVFVDPTGRRHRLLRPVGLAVGCLLGGYLVIVGFGLVTGTGVPLTPWPDAEPTHHAGLPGHGGLVPKRAPSPPRTSGPANGAMPHGPMPGGPMPGTAVPSTRPTDTPTTGVTPTAASPTATATRPGKGHGYGLTKTPHPKKP
jgi:hypothetical protein